MNGSQKTRIGFVSTRLAGTDGVTLEAHKWVSVLNRLNCECYFYAGECEWSPDHSLIVPEAHFDHPEIKSINVDLFDDYRRTPGTSKKIHQLTSYLKDSLYKFIKQYKIEVLIVENALSIPMNVPLGLAITELIAETGIPTFAHHHDFAWERPRFRVSAASDYQLGVFPPILPSVIHIVINSYASRQLALRTGATSILIPNVMDFGTPPMSPGNYTSTLRADIGIEPGNRFLLQPTRIVPRKRIEMAIELTRRLGKSYSLVVSHSSGDEGKEYERYLREYSSLLDVKVIFASERIAYQRGTSANGEKIYSLADAYHHADMITYPSTLEGFGNAFLESIYYKRPIVMSTYEIFRTDIQPKGFRIIGFGDFITSDTVHQVHEWIDNPGMVNEIVQQNYALGNKYFSYKMLEIKLAHLLKTSLGLQ